MENQQVSSSPKDVFLNLLAIVALYLNVVSFGALLFQFVNQWLPDPLAYDSAIGIASAMRWSIAVLIIVVPIYILLSWLLESEYSLIPAKRELKIRKWLLYFTLAVSAVIIAGDLIALIYNFLEGELTMRFIFKILILLALAAFVFWYYIGDLRNSWSSRSRRHFAWSVGVLALVGIVVALLTAGSPGYARQLRFDERRVNDLQALQSEIINFWTRKDVLPKTLSDLHDDISGFVAPTDPVTNGAYEYRSSAPLQFELCAVFTIAVATDATVYKAPYSFYNENWEHGAGRVCFERTIDPDKYGDPLKRKPAI